MQISFRRMQSCESSVTTNSRCSFNDDVLDVTLEDLSEDSDDGNNDSPVCGAVDDSREGVSDRIPVGSNGYLAIDKRGITLDSAYKGDEHGLLDGFADGKLFDSADGTDDDLNSGMMHSFTCRKSLGTTDGEVNDFNDNTLDGFLECLDYSDKGALACLNAESVHPNKITHPLPRLFSNGS